MSTQLQLRRGTTAQHSTFTGASGEITIDTDKKTVVVHDGTTAGGIPQAKDSSVVHNTGNETISGTKTFSSTIQGSISSATNASNVPWSGVSSKPTTLSGYGITDAQPSDTAITTSNIGSQSVNYATSAGSVADGSVTVAKMANSGYEFGMRNRIINGSFEVNQRATSGTITGSAAYTSDRWLAASAVNTTWGLSAGYIGGNALNWTGNAGFTYGWIQQRIEATNVSMLAGKKVTVSGFIYNSVASARTITLGIYTPSAVDNHTTQNLVESFSITLAASGWTYFSKMLTSNLSAEVTKGLAVQFSTTTLGAGEVLAFDFIQLEEGSVATPFEFRQYGTELALCQRYYEVGVKDSANYCIAASRNGSGTADIVLITFKVTKRSSPTVSATASGSIGGYEINTVGTTVYTVGSGGTMGNLTGWSASAEL